MALAFNRGRPHACRAVGRQTSPERGKSRASVRGPGGIFNRATDSVHVQLAIRRISTEEATVWSEPRQNLCISRQNFTAFKCCCLISYRFNSWVLLLVFAGYASAIYFNSRSFQIILFSNSYSTCFRFVYPICDVGTSRTQNGECFTDEQWTAECRSVCGANGSLGIFLVSNETCF